MPYIRLAHVTGVDGNNHREACVQSLALLRPLAWAPTHFISSRSVPCNPLSSCSKSSDPDIYAAMLGEEQRAARWHRADPFRELRLSRGLRHATAACSPTSTPRAIPGAATTAARSSPIASRSLAIERAKSLFRAEHANVQPLCGSPMNQAVYMACLNPRRHRARDGPVARRTSDAWRARVVHGKDLQLRALQDASPPDGHIDYDAVLATARRDETEDRALRPLVVSARTRLRTLPRDRRRSRRARDGGCLARRRPDRGRRACESARCRLRRRHDDDSQVAARSARRHDPVQAQRSRRRSTRPSSPACRAVRT